MLFKFTSLIMHTLIWYSVWYKYFYTILHTNLYIAKVINPQTLEP